MLACSAFIFIGSCPMGLAKVMVEDVIASIIKSTFYFLGILQFNPNG